MNILPTIYEKNNMTSNIKFVNIGKNIMSNNKPQYFQPKKMKFLKGSYESYYSITINKLKTNLLKNNIIYNNNGTRN
jgi:hypothetical protein